MKALFDSVPTLVKTYGNWPSYFVVLLGVAQVVDALAFVVLLHHALR